MDTRKWAIFTYLALGLFQYFRFSVYIIRYLNANKMIYTLDK